MKPFEQICVDIEKNICTITLNRPDRLNAWTNQMKSELIKAFETFDKDDNVRVFIVTGAGEAFCSGVDMTPGPIETVNDNGGGHAIPRDSAGEVALKIYQLRKPVIAAINGPAIGVGCTMTLGMDIRYASEDARFGLVFNRRGLVPEGCSTWFISRIMGIAHAAEWIYTGRVFSATEAFEKGLLNKVLPENELLVAAQETAREIADKTSAMSTALSRQLIWRMMGASHPMEAHRLESMCLDYMANTPDLIEGVVSFLEKRLPNFTLGPEKDKPTFYPWWTEPEY